MGTNGKILIIDDNPKNIQLLGNILSDNNYNVEIALGGYEALEWLKEETFDLILLDVMMPEINGFEVCEKIRSENKNDNVPIIFITAKTDKPSIIRGFSTGGQDYIAKPFDSSELMARVNTHISLKKSKEQLLQNNNLLEEKVRQRTNALEESNKQLLQIDKSKNKFLSFIGKEVSKPLKELNKVVNLIKQSAESSKFLELTNMLENSVDKLQFTTTMASQLTSLNEKKTINIDQQYLNNIVEKIIIDQNQLFSKNKIEVINEIDTELSINCNKDLVKNSIICILELINECALELKKTKFSCLNSNEEVELNLTVLPCSLDFNDINKTPESSTLFLSYSELVMNFHNGSFSFNTNGSKATFNWKFPIF